MLLQEPHAVNHCCHRDDHAGQHATHGGRVSGKDGGTVDEGVGEDAGQEAARHHEQGREAKAQGRGLHQLQHGGEDLRAEEEIDNMAHAEGDGGDDDGGGTPLFFHGAEQQAAENYLLQNRHPHHADDVEGRHQRTVAEGEAVPKVDGGEGCKGHKPHKGQSLTPLKAAVRTQPVLAEEQQQQHRQHQAHYGGNELGRAKGLGEGVGVAEGQHIDDDGDHGEPNGLLIKKLLHKDTSYPSFQP